MITKQNRLTIVLAFVGGMVPVLAGCAVGPPKQWGPHDVYMQTTVEVDLYGKQTWIRGPRYTSYEGEGVYAAFLRANVYGYDILYNLHISDGARNWRFFNRAPDINGTKLPFVEIDQKVTDVGGTSDYFGMILSREYLDKAESAGVNIKVFGKRGERVIILPAFYVEGFLLKVDEHLAISKGNSLVPIVDVGRL